MDYLFIIIILKKGVKWCIIQYFLQTSGSLSLQ